MSRLLIAAAGVAVAAVLFVVLRPNGEEASTAPPAPPSPTETTVTTNPPPPTAARVSIVVREGRPVGGIRRVTVSENRRVILTVRSDVADQVHLHGYDVTRDIAPGRPGRIDFRATIPGRFEVELESAGLQIADLTVNP